MVFNLRDDWMRIYDPDDLNRYQVYGQAVLSGARTKSFVIDTVQEERVFGIQFQPDGTFPFFRLPASEMENQTIDLLCLWGRAGDELRERLLAAPTIAHMFLLSEKFLLLQLVRPLGLHRAVAFAQQQFCRYPHRVSVGSVVADIGMSQRRFIQLFHEQVGLTKKAFCRVRRFQRILHKVHETREVDWADVALTCGYYDQAHFIHDFRDYSGITRSQYLVRATEHLNHVPEV